MSEYQYYEFQAIDRPLDDAERQALRDLSSRARITATSFTNSYEWGDFKGDPAKLMERWFDLHLYLANWGSRRLMIRLPARLVDRDFIDACLAEVDCASVETAGENLILDIYRDEMEDEDWDEDWDEDQDDGAGWLAALAPLRAAVLGGDLRLFYLLWLMAVEADIFLPDQPEPLPGIGPLSAALQAFADFFGIDSCLVEAAAERPAVAPATAEAGEAAREIIAALPGPEKTSLLARLVEGDPHAGAELRARVRERMAAGAAPAATRTVGELQARAEAIRLERARAAAEKHAAEEKRRAEEAEKARKARQAAIARRGDSVWDEVEAEIERRNASGYERAVNLLLDLQAIAREAKDTEGFWQRLHMIRERHGQKGQFIKRLAVLGIAESAVSG